jgi:hypothetical protein
MHDLFIRFAEIVQAKTAQYVAKEEIGYSRAGHAIYGYKFGNGPVATSLIGGCHSDEPVGPYFLRRLVSYLSGLPKDDPLLQNYEWWIIPHANPDGEFKNNSWYKGPNLEYSLSAYLKGAFREAPGDDMEFGFPRSANDLLARPENRAIYKWWKTCSKPLKLHASLHGMGFGAGPWFLLDRSWIFRTVEMRKQCTRQVNLLGYTLHDMERNGEKGFFRIEKGFCTRPDSQFMAQHFVNLNDQETAAKFRPSSMETIRFFYPDSLTLVSEMPLFITPGVGDVLGPPDLKAVFWKDKTKEWTERLSSGEPDQIIDQEAKELKLTSMNVDDQMKLIWRFITAGLYRINVQNN